MHVDDNLGDRNRCNTLRISDGHHIMDGFKSLFVEYIRKLFPHNFCFNHDDNYDDSHDIGRRVSALPDN